MSTNELIKDIEDYCKVVSATDPVITQIPKSYVVDLINSHMEEVITQAHMAGQIDAGVDPSYSNAQSYYKAMLEKS